MVQGLQCVRGEQTEPDFSRTGLRKLQVLEGVGFVPQGKAALKMLEKEEGSRLASPVYFRRVGLFL